MYRLMQNNRSVVIIMYKVHKYAIYLLREHVHQIVINAMNTLAVDLTFCL